MYRTLYPASWRLTTEIALVAATALERAAVIVAVTALEGAAVIGINLTGMLTRWLVIAIGHQRGRRGRRGRRRQLVT